MLHCAFLRKSAGEILLIQAVNRGCLTFPLDHHQRRGMGIEGLWSVRPSHSSWKLSDCRLQVLLPAEQTKSFTEVTVNDGFVHDRRGTKNVNFGIDVR